MENRSQDGARGAGGEASSRDSPDDARRSTLELPAEELRELARAFGGLALECLGPTGHLPVFPETSAAAVAEMFRRPLPREGAGMEEIARDCERAVAHSRRNDHPRMFGYVASPPAPAAVAAGWVAQALNQNVTSWRSSPAATEMERVVVRWLAEMIGYADAGRNEGCGGLLTGGGSAANLNALFVAHRTAARARANGSHDASRRGLWGAGAPMTVYASDQVHLSIPKAADLLGIGREHVRLVASDEQFRLDARALRERIESDEAAGLCPFCVVASAGTVSTGAVDSLKEAARVARGRGLWFHVDGAYGALAASAPGKRELFEGIDEADSVSLDPHKWLYSPVGTGCLILREPSRAREAFAGTEEGYIKVLGLEGEETFAFWDYGVELSRPFRALAIWATLRYYGARRVAACIEEDCALAAYMAERVSAAEDLELLAPAALGICCFRYVGARARRELERAEGEDASVRAESRLDELNARVMHMVQRGGDAYLSNAFLRGRFALRASVTNFRTTRRDIDVTLDVVRRVARELEGDN